MKHNTLKKKIADWRAVVGGWAGIPNAFSTEIYAAQGWDSVTIDMQHGAPNHQRPRADAAGHLRQRRHLRWCACRGTIRPTSCAHSTRRPWPHLPHDQHQGRGRGLCARRPLSADGRAQLRARSVPPSTPAPTTGSTANEECCCFAMVETRQAVSNLHDILSVKGLNGVYMSVRRISRSAWARRRRSNPSDKTVLEAMGIILKETREARPDRRRAHRRPQDGLRRFEEGYHMCTILNDVRLWLTLRPPPCARCAARLPAPSRRRIESCHPGLACPTRSVGPGYNLSASGLLMAIPVTAPG
jgi:4-hydroxy-2-oxoheptanedioate aldolase